MNARAGDRGEKAEPQAPVRRDDQDREQIDDPEREHRRDLPQTEDRGRARRDACNHGDQPQEHAAAGVTEHDALEAIGRGGQGYGAYVAGAPGRAAEPLQCVRLGERVEVDTDDGQQRVRPRRGDC